MHGVCASLLEEMVPMRCLTAFVAVLVGILTSSAAHASGCAA
jgi:hypothetical protein